MKAKPIQVIVWDQYPATATEGVRCIKRVAYTWNPKATWNAIWNYLWQQHGYTDLHFTAIQGGNIIREDTFAHP